MVDTVVLQPPRIRTRIFIDFWNFSLELRRREDAFRIDWRPIGNLLTREAVTIIDPALIPSYEAMHIYGSYDPNKQNDVKFRNWFTNWLDKQPGHVTRLFPRQKKKAYPKCPVCYNEIPQCPECNADMRGTEEKGVDSHIVKDMIALAWEQAYDVAVLVSADRDFVPVAEFLQTKGIKVVHGAFPPKGSELSQKCWGTLDLWKLSNQFRQALGP